MTVEVPQIQFLDDGMVGISGLGAWLDSGYMVYVSSWALLDGFPCSPRTWKLDTTFMSPSYLAVPVRCLVYSWRNAWFDYGYMFCTIQGGIWKNFRLSLRDWVSRLLRSILRPGRHVVDKGSGTFLIGFAGLMPLAQCSHDCGQSADRCFSCSRVAPGNLGIISTSPCVSA